MRSLITLCLTTLVALGCDADRTTSGPEVGTVTHFLSFCETDGDCQLGAADPLNCLCGVCTTGCDTEEICTDLDTAAACLDISRIAGCENVNVPRVCGVACRSDADCPARTRCYEDICLGAAPTPTLSAGCGVNDAACTLCPYPVVPLDAESCYCPTCQASALTLSQCQANEERYRTRCGEPAAHCAGADAAPCPAGTQAGCHNGQCAGLRAAGSALDWSSLPGTRIVLDDAPLTWTRAQLAAGVTVDYGIAIGHPVRGVFTHDDMLGSGCLAAGELVHVVELLSDGVNRFCSDCRPPGSEALCEETDAMVHLLPQTLPRSFTWDGQTGGRDWPAALRMDMPPGEVTLTLRIRGVVEALDLPLTPFELGASRTVTITE